MKRFTIAFIEMIVTGVIVGAIYEPAIARTF
jgi:hypothetical protein